MLKRLVVMLAALPACDLVFSIAPAPDAGAPVDGAGLDAMLPIDAVPFDIDFDQDQLVGAADFCPLIFSPANDDKDHDGIGDECDPEDSDSHKQTRTLLVLPHNVANWIPLVPEGKPAWAFTAVDLQQQYAGTGPALDVYDFPIEPPATISALVLMDPVAVTGNTDRPIRAGVFLESGATIVDAGLPAGVGCAQERSPTQSGKESASLVTVANATEQVVAAAALTPTTANGDRTTMLELGPSSDSMALGAPSYPTTCTTVVSTRSHVTGSVAVMVAAGVKAGVWTENATAKFRVVDLVYSAPQSPP